MSKTRGRDGVPTPIVMLELFFFYFLRPFLITTELVKEPKVRSQLSRVLRNKSPLEILFHRTKAAMRRPIPISVADMMGKPSVSPKPTAEEIIARVAPTEPFIAVRIPISRAAQSSCSAHISCSVVKIDRRRPLSLRDMPLSTETMIAIAVPTSAKVKPPAALLALPLVNVAVSPRPTARNALFLPLVPSAVTQALGRSPR